MLLHMLGLLKTFSLFHNEYISKPNIYSYFRVTKIDNTLMVAKEVTNIFADT